MSSRRRPRVWKSCPVASNSSLHQPTPTPNRTRSPEMTAAVPTSFATVTRSRAGAMYTPLVKVSVRVTAAIAEIRHQVSGQSASGDQIGDPSSYGEYVYGLRSSRG